MVLAPENHQIDELNVNNIFTIFNNLGDAMTSAAQNTSVHHHGDSEVEIESRLTSGVYITVHGHFYQPPRENPYLDTIERQPSAYPFHDWNERIYHECYRPNAFARVLNDQGELLGIVNNFEYLSFNVGPTLMSWLESYDVEVYQRIIEADRQSVQRLNGHGNAIAQVYNHIIMPLANERDKYTQIRWGKADFKSRFGRDPEGMWLAETAIDSATVQALWDEGIKFIILAPSQVERCRPIPSAIDPEPEWHEVGGGQIDPTRPYRCFIDEDKYKYIDIFFYDGPISRDMGFNDVLSNSDHLIGRLGQAVRGDGRQSQLISVATDGETFGHHKGGTEKCLAYAFSQDMPQRGWQVTNFAHYLSIAPPTWEVELKPVTAWSCSHGVDRWQDDCGCGGGGGWHQKWRKPLREGLNWLRDQLSEIYEKTGEGFFLDPWKARDEYIKVIRDRSAVNVEKFLSVHQIHPLSSEEQIDALRLLEMQRHALLMFTSCGWFFEEISRPEGVQILRYAARAMELAGDVTGVQLEPEFVQGLVQAPSNIEWFGNGAQVYRELVSSAQISFEQVAAHYALNSLFTDFPQEHHVYCYEATQLDYQRQKMGVLTLAVGQLRLVSEITRESNQWVFAVLHLGGWDFHCCIQPFAGRRDYTQLKEKLFAALNHASAAKVIVTMTQLLGDQSFSLENLFSEERHRIIKQLTEETKTRLDQLYTQVYRDNYSILKAFHRDELPVPQELQVAAEIALSHRCLNSIRQLEQAGDDWEQMANCFGSLEAIATEADNMRCQLNVPEARQILEQLILRSLWQVLYDGDQDTLIDDIARLERMIDVGNQLRLGLSLAKAQELYFNCLQKEIVPECLYKPGSEGECRWESGQVSPLLRLGNKLAVDVSNWL